AQRKAEPPCSRGEINDAAAAGRLEHRYAEPRAIEHAVQVDVDAAAPVVDTDLLHFVGGTGDACVVHQHVESAEIVFDIPEQLVHLRQIRNVAQRCSDAR